MVCIYIVCLYRIYIVCLVAQWGSKFISNYEMWCDKCHNLWVPLKIPKKFIITNPPKRVCYSFDCVCASAIINLKMSFIATLRFIILWPAPATWEIVCDYKRVGQAMRFIPHGWSMEDNSVGQPEPVFPKQQDTRPGMYSVCSQLMWIKKFTGRCHHLSFQGCIANGQLCAIVYGMDIPCPRDIVDCYSYRIWRINVKQSKSGAMKTCAVITTYMMINEVSLHHFHPLPSHVYMISPNSTADVSYVSSAAD